MMRQAVIFDVDGTLAETEETHRVAFNDTFKHFGLDWCWDRDLYRELLRVTGGKERIAAYAEQCGFRSGDLSRARIAEMHADKTARYTARVAKGSCLLRPGIKAAIRGAADIGLRLAIATTTSHPNVDMLLAASFGAEGKHLFEVVVAGDDVPCKKPAPDVYLRALELLQLPAAECLAIEDSANGVASARAAGLEVWVTPSLYTSHESFAGAARILEDLTGFDALIREERNGSGASAATLPRPK